MNQKIVYIRSIKEYLDIEKKKAKNPKKYESITIIIDIKKLRKEWSKYLRLRHLISRSNKNYV